MVVIGGYLLSRGEKGGKRDDYMGIVVYIDMVVLRVREIFIK